MGQKGVQYNHLSYINDVKLFGKNEERIDSLVFVVEILEWKLVSGNVAFVCYREEKFSEARGDLPKGEVMKEIEQEG